MKEIKGDPYLYKLIFDVSRDVIYTVSSDGFITSLNPAFEVMTEWKIKDSIGKPFFEFLHPDEFELGMKIHNDIQNGITPPIFEMKFLVAPSKYEDIEFSTTPLIKNNKVIGTLGTARNITERKNYENELKKKSYLITSLFDSSPDGFLISDEKGIMIDCNYSVLEFLNTKNKKDVIGKNILEFIDVDDHKRAIKDIETVFKKGVLRNVEYNLIRDGKICFVSEISAKIVKDTDIEQNYIIISAKDITGRKQVQKTLFESEERYRLLVSKLPDIILVHTESKIVYVNGAFESVTGWNYKEALGKSIYEFIKPDDVNITRDNFNKRKKGGNIPQYEIDILTKSGAYKTVEIRASVINYNGIPSIFVVLTDITERKEANQKIKKAFDELETKVNERTKDLLQINNALKEEIEERQMITDALMTSEQRLKTLLDNAPLILFSVDKDGVYTLSEGRGLKNIGQIPGEVVGKNVFETTPNQAIHNNIRKALEGNEVHTLININKTIYETWYSPVYDLNNNISGVTAVSVDVSKEIKAKEQINNSLKEKVVLLKEIHHRVKNNLQIISSLLNLQSNNITDEKIIDVITNAKNRVKTMVLIHEKLYQSENLADINFNEYIEDLVNDLISSYNNSNRVINTKINVQNIMMDLDKSIPCGLIINEIVTNSLKYAFANRKKGTISVEFYIDKNRKYNLIIGDDGIGLPKGLDIDNLKSLGMQLLVSLTDQLQGTYEIKTKPNEGTKIHIRF
ncbi:MAG: PAS domain S-box protein [Bacteroidota bacterium]|nr:PAS domain S-box protein [Bacteroidota bacterium]